MTLLYRDAHPLLFGHAELHPVSCLAYLVFSSSRSLQHCYAYGSQYGQVSSYDKALVLTNIAPYRDGALPLALADELVGIRTWQMPTMQVKMMVMADAIKTVVLVLSND